MINYCPKCGVKIEAGTLFCTNCGIRIQENTINNLPSKSEEIQTFENQISYVSKETGTTANVIYTPPVYYTQPQNYIAKKQPHKKRMILAATAVAIAFMIVLASILIIYIKEPNNSRNLSEIKKLIEDKGPKISLQSLSGGTVSSIPEEGYTAKYGLYDESGIFGTPGLRIGQISEENLGETTYQDEECILIKTKGDISIPIKNYMTSYLEDSYYYSTDSTTTEMLNMLPDEIPFYIYADYYVTKNDNTPVYMDYTIDFTEYMQIMYKIFTSMDLGDHTSMPELDESVIMGYTIDWDRAQSKADMSFYMEGMSYMNMDADCTIEFSDEYWDMEPEIEDLYVGFEKIVEFTMTLKINDFDYNIYDDTAEEEPEYDLTDIYSEDELSQTITTTMEIKVTDQEDVNVPVGTFQDCFVLEVNEKQNTEYGYYTSSSYDETSSTKIWVSQNGVMIKAEYSLFGESAMGMDSNSQKFVIEIEDYIK